MTNFFNVDLPSLSGPQNTGTSAALAAQLAKKADLNRDGQVSNAEFAQFLADMLATPEAGQRAADAPGDVVSDILARHDSTPIGLRDALAAIQQAMPGTSLIGSDALSVPGLGRVTVGLGSAPGAGWHWALGDKE